MWVSHGFRLCLGLSGMRVAVSIFVGFSFWAATLRAGATLPVPKVVGSGCGWRPAICLWDCDEKSSPGESVPSVSSTHSVLHICAYGVALVLRMGMTRLCRRLFGRMLECRPAGFSLYTVPPCIGELISMVPDLVTAFEDFHLQSFASGFGWALTGTKMCDGPLVRPVLMRCGRPHSLGRSNPGHVVKPLAPSCRRI